MKKIWKIVIGGIQSKVYNLVIVTILFMLVAFFAVVFFQARKIGKLVTDTNSIEEEMVDRISGETMETVVKRSLSSSTRLEAEVANRVFDSMTCEVLALREHVQNLFNYRDEFDSVPVTVQIVSEEGVDISRLEENGTIGLLGNMSDILDATYRNTRLNSCFVATPDGIAIIARDNTDIKTLDVRHRQWYTGAVETGNVFFTDVEKDTLSDNYGIVCSAPVYSNGKLVAVVGADLFLRSMANAVESSDSNGAFACIINDDGKVIFSPRSEGVLRAGDSESLSDLRKEPGGFGEFVDESIKGTSDVRILEIDGSKSYVSSAPISSVGWIILNIVDVETTRKPLRDMQEGHDRILRDALASFDESMRYGKMTVVVLILVIVLVAMFAAGVVSRHIVRPLEVMTRKVTSLGGDNLLFEMEDAYRTDDEIEVLAGSFAKLSKKTLLYVDEVKRVTAEKERMTAELSVARSIQASQLPSDFPPFPQRSDIDLFALMDPAKEVGGDFYDFFMIDDDHLGLVIADVSGKGIPAALFMMISRILIKNCLTEGMSPSAALADANNKLLEKDAAEMFVTVWAAVIDLQTGEGVASNAGHEYPCIRHGDDPFVLVRSKHSPAVATLEDLKFEEHSFKMDPGACLFVYTDGVTEACDPDDNMFGTDRLLLALNKENDADAEKILYNVRNAIEEFGAGAEQFDDITMLCFRYRPSEPGEGTNKETGSMKELVIDAKVNNLDTVIGFLDEYLEEISCPPKTAIQLDVAVEEIYVNIASYAYGPEGGKAVVRISHTDDPKSVTVSFEDEGTPFDPLARQDPDTTLSAEERGIGGLGIYMVKKSMDDVQYEYSDGKNIFKMVKIL